MWSLNHYQSTRAWHCKDPVSFERKELIDLYCYQKFLLNSMYSIIKSCLEKTPNKAKKKSVYSFQYVEEPVVIEYQLHLQSSCSKTKSKIELVKNFSDNVTKNIAK